MTFSGGSAGVFALNDPISAPSDPNSPCGTKSGIITAVTDNARRQTT